MRAKKPIFIDYPSKDKQHSFHLPLTVFKKPSNQQEYDFLEGILDKLIDEVRDD
jgi:HTH-type transcriptional regulator/antitoxin HigA